MYSIRQHSRRVSGSGWKWEEPADRAEFLVVHQSLGLRP
jgi:hypothetical protein